MNEKLKDLLFQFAVVAGMISGAAMTYFMDSISVLIGSGAWLMIVLIRIGYNLRRLDATNERSTSQDIDV